MLEWPLSERQEITNAGVDVEEREHLCTVGGTVNWYSCYGKQHGDSSKKLKIEIPYDPAILFLGIYPKKTKTLIRKDICTSMSITALFTMPRYESNLSAQP